MFWTPLDMIESMYEEEGFEAYSDYHSGAREFPAWAERLFDDIEAGSGRSLDIGCADGAVVARLDKSGFDAFGIDLDGRSLDVARSRRGLKNLFHGTLAEFREAYPMPEGTFDLITCFEVLEHQTAPREFLRDVAGLARSGARFIGSVPNRNRFAAGIDRRLSSGDHPPHHFLWFSGDSLQTILENAGFRDISVSAASRPGFKRRVVMARRLLRRLIEARVPRLPKLLAKCITGLLAIPAGAMIALGELPFPPRLYFSCVVPEYPSRIAVPEHESDGGSRTC
jgi:SAM-dependent methyltransferase